MLYFKDFVYDNMGNRHYKIAESETQQEQIYTDEQLYGLLEKIGFTSVYGVRYTGSDFNFYKSTPATMVIDQACIGATFQLIVDDEVGVYRKVGNVVTSIRGYYKALQPMDGTSPRITKEYLLKHPDAVVQFI